MILCRLVSLSEETYHLQHNWPEHADDKVRVVFRCNYDSEGVAFFYQVQEPFTRAVYLNDGDPVWQDSCLEVFIQIPGRSEDYINIEMNTLGAVLAARGPDRFNRIPLTSDELAGIERMPAFRNPSDICPQPEYNAGFKLPWNILGLEKAPQELRLNVYKCGNALPKPHYLSLYPITTPTPDFHRPEFFGPMRFDS